VTDAGELLEQTTTYVVDGRTYYVAELTVDQLGDALARLNRYATELHWNVHRGSPDVTDDAARDWLHERPLYRRLLTEQRRRAASRRREEP
jgi:hypothetical protein